MKNTTVKEKLHRKDTMNRVIKKEGRYILSTKTEPKLFFKGGNFASPETTEDIGSAIFLDGEELINMEYCWDLAWDALFENDYNKIIAVLY